MIELMRVSTHPKTILSFSVGVRFTTTLAKAAAAMSNAAQFSMMKSIIMFSIYLCVI